MLASLPPHYYYSSVLQTIMIQQVLSRIGSWNTQHPQLTASKSLPKRWLEQSTHGGAFVPKKNGIISKSRSSKNVRPRWITRVGKN